MKFKKGDTVRCVDARGLTKLTYGEEFTLTHDENCDRWNGKKKIWVKSRWWPVARFALIRNGEVVCFDDEETDHPTLSDFDRIRLGLTTDIFCKRNGSFEDCLADADILINLIMDNPFKRTV